MNRVPETNALSRRRVVLAGAAAVPLAAAGLASAQMGTPPMPAVGGGMLPPGAEEAAELAVFSGLSSEAMTTMASDPAVKEFAKLEAEEQQTLAEIMRAGLDLAPPELSDEHSRKLEEMKGMSSGKQLDKMYLDEQVKGHEKLKELHTKLSKSGPLTVPAVAVTKLSVCAIKSHLAMLEMIRKQMN